MGIERQTKNIRCYVKRVEIRDGENVNEADHCRVEDRWISVWQLRGRSWFCLQRENANVGELLAAEGLESSLSVKVRLSSGIGAGKGPDMK